MCYFLDGRVGVLGLSKIFGINMVFIGVLGY